MISGSFGRHGDGESLVRRGVGGVVSRSCGGHFDGFDGSVIESIEKLD